MTTNEYAPGETPRYDDTPRFEDRFEDKAEPYSQPAETDVAEPEATAPATGPVVAAPATAEAGRSEDYPQDAAGRTEEAHVVTPVTDDGLSATPDAADTTADLPVATPDQPVAAGTDWRELQGRFVDDPEAAVREAGVLVEQELAALRSRLETGDTENLRTAFRRYRDLHSALN